MTRSAPNSPLQPGRLERAYVRSRFGQSHIYKAGPGKASSDLPPLVFFHQTPRSSIEYKPLLLEMAKDRQVIAIDTPGYGYSDRPPTPPTMTSLAQSMSDVLDELGFGADGAGPVDTFGFHTGVFIQSELSILRPDLTRRMVMSGIGYFSEPGRRRRYDELPRTQRWHQDGALVMQLWNKVVVDRPGFVSIDRAVELFLEDVRSAEKYWYAYDGVWSYPVEERFALLSHPIFILQANEPLWENTRNAQRELLPDVEMIEMPDVITPVFDCAPKRFARHIRSWLV